MVGGCPPDAKRSADRGTALERLILDTTILVDSERERRPLDDLIADDDDVAMAVITAAELLVGVELSEGRWRRERQRYVSDALAVIPVEEYDLDVARAHASLLAHTRRSGGQRDAHDLIIAATAIARSRIVVTAAAPGFEDLPGLEIRAG